MAAAALRSLHFLMALILFVTALALAQDGSQFIYNGFRGANLHLDGNATVHPNGLLQLTNIFERQRGYAFYPIPIKFNISSSKSLVFSTCFVSAIVPQLPELNLSGHGMTFVISPSMDFSGATATAYLGLLNSTNDGRPTNHILAVELDTIGSPEFKDIDDNHVGIDVNSMTSNASATASYFSEEEGKNISLMLISGKPVQIWIDYDGAEMLLNVTIAPISIRTKPSRPLLSDHIDLSQVLQETMYVGFTAATGAIRSYHYVLGWSFNRSGKTESFDVTNLPQLPPPPSIPRKGSQISEVMLIVVVVAVVLVLTTVGGAFYIVRKKKYEEVYEDWEREYSPHRFSYKALYKATQGFKDSEIIGKGGFGKVYKGVLPSLDEVAVKKVSHDSGKQGMQQFVSEIVSMGRLRHRNLVQLRGYCRRKGELLLVYDYMPNGSLDKVLYSNTRPNLNWFQRIRILKGVACGLHYLHEDWEQVVLHRDIKSGNVLLDADLNGKLGDFGLARLYEHDSIPQTTHLVGTVGYLAPELVRTGQATTNTDVYAFGAFMLEVACGRRPIELGKEDLVDWVIECWKKGSILDASDPRLEGLYVGEQMEVVLKLGLFCSHPNPADRPSMRHVMQYLDGDAKFPDISPDGNLLDAFIKSYNQASKMTPFSSLFGSSTSSQAMSATTDSLLIAGR